MHLILLKILLRLSLCHLIIISLSILFLISLFDPSDCRLIINFQEEELVNNEVHLGKSESLHSCSREALNDPALVVESIDASSHQFNHDAIVDIFVSFPACLDPLTDLALLIDLFLQKVSNR